ncbi:NAD-dependent epimerase/dehydratase family protein [Lacibacterium aquatile]|uniref:NAD-dependent epimerase/dehydratase family protein n=1 Tax=Lacibacterium aquatile TaxID=1168082 RepID=A0ABW5DU21_9PROT
MLKNQTILITGGAGFIGSTIAQRLVDENDVIVFDNMSRNALKDSPVAGHPRLTVVQGDVLDEAAVTKVVGSADYIVHAAGVAGIDTVGRKPVNTMRVNMVGSANVLEAAAQTGRAKRVLCFSTSEVFGQHAMGATETDRTVIGAVGEARWTYAVSKLAEEHLAIAYHKQMGLGTSVVRPFNVYGPGQVGEGALRTFIQRALRNETIEIHGNGTQIRAWCYVDDMVDGALAALTLPQAIGESFNIGNARSVETIYGLANTVIRVLGSKSEITFIRKDYADVELRVPSIGKAKDMLGFEAQVSLEEGIRRTADFIKASL